jgi:hypothetical protein
MYGAGFNICSNEGGLRVALTSLLLLLLLVSCSVWSRLLLT